MTIIDHLDLDQSHRALIEQACDGSERVYLAPMDKGLSGASVWQARWVIPRTGHLSELHVFKIARRKHLLREVENIEKYVSVIDTVPNVVLYPRIPSGAGEQELALLRQRFAGGSTGRAISLRHFLQSSAHCPNAAAAVSVMAQLYEQKLANWHGPSSDPNDASTPEQISVDSLSRDLWWWSRKIDLTRAASDIGASALDASLKEMTGLTLQDVVEEVERISNLRPRKRLAIIHGDLHPQNVLVDSEQKLHIIDFGATCVGWRAADFLMMECALRFTTSPPNALLENLLEIDEIAETQWNREEAIFADKLESRCYGRDLNIIASATCAIRRFAQRYGATESPEEYRAGLILLTAAMASYPILVNRNYVFHSLAKQLRILQLSAPAVRRNDRIRCVGFFGPSGSGKTTLAEGVARAYETAVVVEAFPDIIEPLLAKGFAGFPQFTDTVDEHHDGKLARTVSIPLRKRSRELFRKLSEELGSAWLGNLLEEWRIKTYPDRLVVVSGLRGLATARMLKDAGWFVAYLTASPGMLARRQSDRDGVTFEAAMDDQRAEEDLYHTTQVQPIADLVVDVEAVPEDEVRDKLLTALDFSECTKCINTNFNPAIRFTRTGLCQTCADYEQRHSRKRIEKELESIKALKGHGSPYDGMVGLSGGKDSTVAAWHLKEEMGFKLLGFTFDFGYYPESVITRGVEAARLLGIDHEVIDIRSYLDDHAKECYKETANLFDSLETYERRDLSKVYMRGREHYKVSDSTMMPFLRTCQLCRKTVIRAYYGEARRRNISAVFLGMNEWVGLSADAAHKAHHFSGIRELKPSGSEEAVRIVHLPYLLGTTLSDVKTILQSLGWKRPSDEDLVESNANSCHFAAAGEYPFRKALGFHPDSNRLAREITTGFLPKHEAIRALSKRRITSKTVRETLEGAGIL